MELINNNDLWLVSLTTCMFDQVMILQGEIRCLSLLGLKGLKWEIRGLNLFPGV